MLVSKKFYVLNAGKGFSYQLYLHIAIVYLYLQSISIEILDQQIPLLLMKKCTLYTETCKTRPPGLIKKPNWTYFLSKSVISFFSLNKCVDVVREHSQS